MVNQLRVEMHERFDRVDAALNQIYDTMNDRFNRIDVVLGILVGDVQEIQESLYNLQSDLYRIERKVFTFLDAGFRRDLNEAINGYLGYKDTYGTPIPWLSYIYAENKFYTWAVNNALDEISSGSAGRAYDDSSIYAELTSQPLENNLNYLSEYLTTRGWPSFAQVRLANPRDWAIAAESSIQLASESPLFFRGISSNRLEQIYRVGLELQRAIGNITLQQTNLPAAPNRVLFNLLSQNYRLKAAVFQQKLYQKELESWIQVLNATPATVEDRIERCKREEVAIYTSYQNKLATNSDPVVAEALIAERDEILLGAYPYGGATRAAYINLISQLSQAGDLVSAGRDLSGAKALLDALINLGFSQSLETDDFVHSFLYGKDRVLDLDATKELYQRSVDGEFNAWPQNRRVNFIMARDERISALDGWVSNRLNQVQTNGYAESLRLVSSTVSRLEAFRAGWHQSPSVSYLAPLGLRLTNGVPNRMFVVWGEPNVRYTVQFSTNLIQWIDLPTSADEGQEFVATPTGRYGFYRAVLRP
jgi:hypothetical protein